MSRPESVSRETLREDVTSAIAAHDEFMRSGRPDLAGQAVERLVERLRPSTPPREKNRLRRFLVWLRMQPGDFMTVINLLNLIVSTCFAVALSILVAIDGLHAAPSSQGPTVADILGWLIFFFMEAVVIGWCVVFWYVIYRQGHQHPDDL